MHQRIPEPGGTSSQGSIHAKVSVRVTIAMSRFFIVSAIWLGLLGAAEPVLACVMNPPACECCPWGMQPSCDHDSGATASGVAARLHHCASVRMGDMLAVAMPKSDAGFPHGISGADNPPFIAARATDLPVHPDTLISGPQFIDFSRSDGALTYLRTGRLRL